MEPPTYIHVQAFVQMCVFISLESIQGMELLGHMGTLRLTFRGIARLFSKGAAPFYILTSSSA